MKEGKGTRVSRRNFLKLSGMTTAGAAGVLGGGLSGILSGPGEVFAKEERKVGMNGSQMLFLTYTPRSDSEERGYGPWLRKVDNPFFNSVPGIAHYTNWKVVKGGEDVITWTYFDFLRLENGVTLETVWENEDLTKFAAGWTKLWGRAPDAADMAVNYQVHMTNLSKPGSLDTAQLIAVVLSPDLAALPANAALFTVEKNILGKAVSGQVAVVGLELTKGEYSPSWGKHIIIAECLASPH